MDFNETVTRSLGEIIDIDQPPLFAASTACSSSSHVPLLLSHLLATYSANSTENFPASPAMVPEAGDVFSIETVS